MLHRRSIIRVASVALIAALALPITARSDEQIGHAQMVVAKNGMVVAQEAVAARVGADILRQGGNAVDAAVAVGFALAVTYPRAGNLGGGGFMLIHQASGNDTAIDYRETAPAAISNKTFLDAQGNADPQKSRDSALAIGVPGTVEGLAFAARRYGSGRFTLADLIAPAIALARGGMPVTDDLADMSQTEHARLLRWPSSVKLFLKSDGAALSAGDRLVQSDLANTLEAIVQESNPKPVSVDAKARPCTSPKPPAMKSSRPRKIGTKAWTAETRIERAMADSTTAPGSRAHPSAPSRSVTEWPTVNAVTTLTIRRKAVEPPA